MKNYSFSGAFRFPSRANALGHSIEYVLKKTFPSRAFTLIINLISAAKAISLCEYLFNHLLPRHEERIMLSLCDYLRDIQPGELFRLLLSLSHNSEYGLWIISRGSISSGNHFANTRPLMSDLPNC